MGMQKACLVIQNDINIANIFEDRLKNYRPNLSPDHVITYAFSATLGPNQAY